MENGLIIFSGNANPLFTKKICEYLEIEPGKALIGRFSDGEIQIEIRDNVRSKDVFVVQPTCLPVNRNLMELLLMIDALKRSSARRITAVIPYFGYARQDKKVAPRVPISARLIADMLTVAGANRVITMDLHAGQIQGFFNIPVDNLFAKRCLIKVLEKEFEPQIAEHSIVVVSPDAGGVERARAYAKSLDASIAIIDKRRLQPNQAKAMNLVGDVKEKIAILVDDMVDTLGTTVEASEKIIESGAKEVYAACAHPVLSGKAIERLIKSPIKKLWVSDSIPLKDVAEASGKIEVCSVAEMFAEAILRSHTGDSVTSLFI